MINALLPALRHFGVELAGLFFGVRLSDRMCVFIDYQNTYKGARDAFFRGSTSGVEGQFHPLALANIICNLRSKTFVTTLEGVYVYRGMPDVRKDPRGNSAGTRQKDRWEKSGVIVKTRPLRYPVDWPNEKPQEKGVDVHLAIDYVAMAMRGDYDVGVLISCDTDLRPALEEARKFGRKVEVAAWQSDNGSSPRLSLPHPEKIWCHWLDLRTFGRCSDPTDYGKPMLS